MDLYIVLSAILLIASVYFFTSWQKVKSTLEGTRELLTRSEDVLKEIVAEKGEEQKKRIEAETEVKLVQQKNEALIKDVKDWEKTKERHLEAAQSSMLKAAREMSNKLLDDHKRESKTSKKESEEQIKKVTFELEGKFGRILDSVASLNDQVKDSKETVDIVRRSLLSPAGAGSLAEITLENIFTASGLIENTDYELQYWIEGEKGGSKPDAIVYLPGNNIMVIDSKASKFLMEIGEVKNDPNRIKEVEAQLKATMNNHLKDLVKRKYGKIVREHLKKSGRIDDVSNVTVYMFLPTEPVLEKLRKIDPKFMEKAWKERIFPITPTGLVNALLQAELIISTAKQERNSEIIIAEITGLLSSISKLHELSYVMGKSIKGTMDKYDKFAGSFNRTFLSKTKKLEKLGILSGKNIQSLERYTIVPRDSIIEVELLDEEESQLDAIETTGLLRDKGT